MACSSGEEDEMNRTSFKMGGKFTGRLLVGDLTVDVSGPPHNPLRRRLHLLNRQFDYWF
jgi:hypothetical protein